jgi:hypothetical protein
MRPRYSVAGRKSDSLDSFVLAELARTDSHRSRVLVPDSDGTNALRAMTRARESLVRSRVGLANQLRDQLAYFWPSASKVFWSVNSQIALAPSRSVPNEQSCRWWRGHLRLLDRAQGQRWLRAGSYRSDGDAGVEVPKASDQCSGSSASMWLLPATLPLINTRVPPSAAGSNLTVICSPLSL